VACWEASALLVASGGRFPLFNLGATQVAVWQVTNVPSTQPEIGAVGPTMGRAGDTVTIGRRGVWYDCRHRQLFLHGCNHSVLESLTDKGNSAQHHTGGTQRYRGGEWETSNAYRYDVLTGPQVNGNLHVNAQTVSGQNVYVVGSVHELDNWDAVNVYYSMFNPSYPAWFLPVSVPASTAIQYKYIKRDGSGNVIWQADPNLTLTTPASGEADTTTYVWP